MSHERSVSAPDHGLTSETVWQFRLPEIRFGRDAIEELPHQLRALGIDEDAHGLIVTDETLSALGHVDRVRERIETDGLAADVYDGVEREPSIAAVEACIAFVRERRGEAGYDYYLGLGGGSCMDTAKATRVVIENGGDVLEYVAEPTGEGRAIPDPRAPLVLVPTTAGTGAEISPVAILSVEAESIKEGISSDSVRADAAVLDPTLTTTLPPEITAETAMDALGHAIEGYTTHAYDSLLRADDPATRPVYAGRTPVTEQFSVRAIELLSANVRQVVNNGDDLEARSAMLQGALFGAIAGLTAGATLCHAMAYPVGNRYHTTHGETIAVLTPASTLGYNAASDPERFAEVARLLGVETREMSARDAADAAKDAYVRLQCDLHVLPSGLAELADVREEDLHWLATRTVESQERLLRTNPRPVTVADVEAIYYESLYNWEPGDR